MQLRVVPVEAHQDAVREVLADFDHLGLDPFEGRQVPGLTVAVDVVDGVDAPVLVALLVLDVEEVTVVVGPEEAPDAALAVMGDGPSRLDVVQGGQEDIEDPVVGRNPSHQGAVGRDPGAEALRIAEQDPARDERDGVFER